MGGVDEKEGLGQIRRLAQGGVDTAGRSEYYS